MRFPVLVSHYLEHKWEKPDMSVAAFIKLHYFSKFVKDKDFMQDMRLPFKSEGPAQLLSVLSAIIPQNLAISIKAAEFDIYRCRPEYTEKIIMGIAVPIWQPPQKS